MSLEDRITCVYVLTVNNMLGDKCIHYFKLDILDVLMGVRVKVRVRKEFVDAQNRYSCPLGLVVKQIGPKLGKPLNVSQVQAGTKVS